MTVSSVALFVEKALARLLSAPHITIPRFPLGGGPGPIDLFGTEFENTFSDAARGSVDGEDVDRDGLREKLLALQRHYNPDTVKFQIFGEDDGNSEACSEDEARLSFNWTDKQDPTEQREVLAGANVVVENGSKKISFLKLRGNRWLFQAPDEPVSVQ